MIQEIQLRGAEIAMRQMLEAEMNIAESAGDSGMMARVLAKMEAFSRRSNTTTNTLNVSNSVVGAVTTGGAIRSLNVKISALTQKPETEQVAKALNELKEAIVQSRVLTSEQRTEAVERLDFLADQASRPPEGRQGSVTRLVLVGLQTSLSVVADVLAVWNQWGPILLAYYLSR